ncbi:DUF2252 domain-containing protein [Deinococcus multiflagellatus]|uniref:DUF2252 domain-containing protein n=1 Tax=Deinococcus multiflagellatus TaxID=1656887 RepID=UPI001CCB5972|nr:DUF2252 domain-containing protein [Deinococcus multiflagellatus]MBZ9715894.1 DUF2252 domain-containing protein [Deinococcus multiflagellatus]
MHDPFSPTPLPSRAERRAQGRALRAALPRRAHATFAAPGDRPDTVLDTLRAAASGCLPHLVPLRYGRMVASPFAFFRGSAALMAADLATTPTTGAQVQASGDAHCANFGAFATGERNLVFDLNDFDETLRAPWEWDTRRLCASLVLAGREAGHGEADARFAARSAARAYRLHLRAYAQQPHIDVWYDRIDASEALADMAADARAHGRAMFDKASTRTHLHTLKKLAVQTPAGWRLRDDPPLLVHAADPQAEAMLEGVKACYLDSVAPDRRMLLSRYHLADWALKVTGVGSCGRRVLVLLLAADGDDVLFLQVKEARPSVLEPHAGPSVAHNPAHRIVRGQQLMQAATDPFLGWCSGGGFAYVRQLRDLKGRFELHAVTPRTLEEIAELCGWALARAHARTGDAVALGAYLGGGENFDEATAAFAVAYADQAERDHAALARVVARGDLEVETGPA